MPGKKKRDAAVAENETKTTAVVLKENGMDVETEVDVATANHFHWDLRLQNVFAYQKYHTQTWFRCDMIYAHSQARKCLSEKLVEKAV